MKQVKYNSLIERLGKGIIAAFATIVLFAGILSVSASDFHEVSAWAQGIADSANRSGIIPVEM